MWSVHEEIAKGEQGRVYKARLISSNHEHRAYCVKVERTRSKGVLRKEYTVYRKLSGRCALCSHYFFGSALIHGSWKDVLVLEKHQKLRDVESTLGGRRDRKKLALRTGLNLLSVLCHLHRLKYVHMDIHPDNVVYKWNRKDRQYDGLLIDFGSASRSSRPTRSKRVDCIFGSNDLLRGRSSSPKDDLESLVYLIYWLYTKWLPWEKETSPEAVMRRRAQVSIRKDFTRLTPYFQSFYRYVRKLSRRETPDYAKMSSLLLKACRRV